MKNIDNIHKNSMFYWYPIVQKCDIPSPKTVLVPFKGKIEYKIFDGEKSKDYSAFVKLLETEADKIGYPLFMRTDETSNKFEWGSSCYIASKDKLYGNLLCILEMIEMSFGLGFKGVALREFLKLESTFTSHRGMPVAKEFRLFVRNGKLECLHPYWPKASIKTKEDKWENKLDQLRLLNPDDINTILQNIAKFGSELPEYWSIDFCKTTEGKWYLTDMAIGEDSYHWSTCSYAPKEMLEQYGEPDNLKPESDFENLLSTLTVVQKEASKP
jgi:hypothetical protein